MTREAFPTAGVNLLSRGWKAAAFGETLPTMKDKMEGPCRLYRRNRRAAAAVEFAFVAPVFLLLVLGTIEYRRLVMVQQVITYASCEGARVADLDDAKRPEMEALVRSYGQSGLISGSTIHKPLNFDNAGFGDPITNKVSIPFNQVSWLLSPMYLGGQSLSATTIMRRQSVQ